MPSEISRIATNIGFPISCIAITENDEIIIGGGGGPGRSGVKNKIIIGKINPEKLKLSIKAEHEFGNDEDAPTCIALHPRERNLVAGVNCKRDEILNGENKSVRVFEIQKKKFIQKNSVKINDSIKIEDYLKFIVFDKKGSFLCCGSSDGTFSCLNFPSLTKRIPTQKANQEVVGADINLNSKLIAIVTASELRVINSNTGDLVQTVSDPHVASGEGAMFRALKFGNTRKTSHLLYTVLNMKSRKGAYIAVWNMDTWKRTITKQVSKSPVTSFCISFDKNLVAVANSTNEIIILDLSTLKIVLSIPNAHTFAITSLSFNKSSNYLVSGSADETYGICIVPDPTSRTLISAIQNNSFIATTPLASEVVDAITNSLSQDWGNPSSLNEYGIGAKRSIENARTLVGNVIGADSKDIVFTSGGTESNNVALFSALKYWENGGYAGIPHFITSEIEHPAVLEPIRALVLQNRITVSFLPTLKSGSVDVSEQIVTKILAENFNTVMISVMLVNNETGVINDIKSLTRIAKENGMNIGHKIFVHTDAAQAIGKIGVDVDDLDVDYLTVVGHKIYGPRIGALYAKNAGIDTPIYPLMFGGGQERGFRPGTENTPMIVGLGKACELVSENLCSYIHHYEMLKTHFLKSIEEKKPKNINIIFHGHQNKPKLITPNVVNFSIQLSNCFCVDVRERVSSADLTKLLEERGISIGRGSACHSGLKICSPVLTAMGIDSEIAGNSLRFSVGRGTSVEDVDFFVKCYWEVVNEML
ncbi:hypothetical protein BB558_005299 [Smittium angustum]|uniref:Selenocysteine lyase n=1 Tax=Smittium angustum TaxID=133377 RepID=A0A2U1J0V5_SMIAN|nr:hypothetical protein BB558_005299 [Smittium angustum]